MWRGKLRLGDGVWRERHMVWRVAFSDLTCILAGMKEGCYQWDYLGKPAEFDTCCSWG